MGGGKGGGGKKGGGGDAQTITTRNEMDPQDRAHLDAYQEAARSGFDQFQNRGAVPGVGQDYGSIMSGYRGMGQNLSPEMQQAADAAGGLTQGLNFASQTGMGGIGEYMDPYQSQVMQGFEANVQRQREQSARRAGDVATQSGAFGGNRGAVLEAEGLRDINQMGQSGAANLLSSGYGQAQQQMMADRQRMGSMGMMGMQNLYNIGQFQGGQQAQGLAGMRGMNEYQRNVAMQQRNQPFQDYQQAMGLMGQPGQGGSTSTQSTPTSGGGAFQGALGGAMSGFGMGGPIGGAIGGGLGLLGGLF